MPDSLRKKIVFQKSIAWSRLIALTVAAAITAPCVAVSLTALGAPAVVAHVAAGIFVLTVGAIVNARASVDIAGLQQGSRYLFVLWLILGAGAVYRVSSLALFIDDVSRTEHAYQSQFREMDDPELTKPFYPRHNCSTCYLVAAHLAGSGEENLYDRKHYRNAEVLTPIHEEIGEALNIDQYQYPPPFLLGPHLALLTGLDFYQIRALWFGFSVGLFLLASGVVTVWICGWKFHALWLIWPAMLISPSVIATLQMGNAHAFMILVAVLAMVAFDRNWHFLGGGLLAYAALSKFFPGILLAYLLFQRRWQACGWTVAWIIILCAVTVFVFGLTPFEAFLSHQLPAIASGEAFSFAFNKPAPMLNNSSIMGIPYKLDAIGIALPWDLRATARALTWLYTLVVLAVLILAGRRSVRLDAYPTEEGRLRQARLWMALLVLAQLRSPFLPGVYGNTAILILLALLLPLTGLRLPRLGLIAVGVLVYATVLPLPFGPASSAFDYGFSLVATLLAAGVAIAVALGSSMPCGTASFQRFIRWFGRF